MLLRRVSPRKKEPLVEPDLMILLHFFVLLLSYMWGGFAPMGKIDLILMRIGLFDHSLFFQTANRKASIMNNNSLIEKRLAIPTSINDIIVCATRSEIVVMTL
ncbi:hypothetical protein L1987_49052 [Smallanthus sonchifolius]|uniref:Uncharacterized protein n=1 Tax=Smallanthus sonchifolius TaxID=185202 RepID=A0ACB9FTF1_9ASTR|nr:hypothetical protein L1987_49052 [Smallanthus sonchifolius]